MQLFEDFPKKREKLPESYEKIYLQYYKNNRAGSTVASFASQLMESWMHRRICEVSHRRDKILEIGGGNLNHFAYEQPDIYDVVEPFNKLYENSKYISRVNDFYSDISEISLRKMYDRIISIATFEHILNLPAVVAKCCIVLNPRGVMQTSIPSEGTFLWELGWKLTTGLEFWLQHRLDYGVLMRYEHVNTASEIEEVLNYFFSKTRGAYFGLSKRISFYHYYECRYPKVKVAKEYLSMLEAK